VVSITHKDMNHPLRLSDTATVNFFPSNTTPDVGDVRGSLKHRVLAGRYVIETVLPTFFFMVWIDLDWS